MNGLVSTEEYRSHWKALFAAQSGDLRQDLIFELSQFLGLPYDDTVALVDGAKGRFAEEWRQLNIDAQNAQAVAQFYSSSEVELYELVEWYGTDTSHHYFLLRCAEILRAERAKSILDFGSGIGTAAIVFGTSGLKVTLADISDRLLEFAAQRCRHRRINFETLHVTRDGLPQMQFDAIACLDVLEHIPDAAGTLRQLRKLLKPGGLLFVHAPTRPDADRPMHLMRGDGLFRRIRSMGFDAVWDWKFPPNSREPRIYRRADRSLVVNGAYFVRDEYMSGRMGDVVSAAARLLRRRDRVAHPTNGR